MKQLRYTIISSLLAFVLWGTWALYTNFETPNALVSALAQGLYSGAMTIFIVYIIEYFSRVLPTHHIFMFLPALIVTIMSCTAVWLIHTIIGTTHIAPIVWAIGVVVFIFSSVTTLKITKESLV